MIAEPRHDLPSYLWPRPKYRGFLHAAGAFAIVPLGALLVASASSPRARLAAAIYVVAQLFVFSTSALYHLVASTPTARRRMQMADHLMIYVLIAGTWVPVCLLVLPGSQGAQFLAGVSAIAVAGIVLKSFGIHRFPKSSNTLYVVMGLVALLALPAIIRNTDMSALVLLATGGVAYLLGALVLMRKHPDPRPSIFGYHEVWHAFTVVAAACHFAMVWIVVGA
ncbi:PAQR family membrane homeostasis protein TrhA [Actinospongicola halichondriae]|uniref:PAQR family membrane homeostasis protein TrhA n=1 Tax=Actinospongicola halichondriae TaxID=3236844 RepID=UPI003D49E538